MNLKKLFTMAALTALLPVVLANNQTTSSIATNSQSTTAENNAPALLLSLMVPISI